MTAPAREKLDEARYFLRLMEETKMKSEFQYNLSAFLSAARSVTIYLQKQYTGEPGFEEWYSAKQEEMRNSPLFVAMKEARNHALKEDYPRVKELYMNVSGNEDVDELTLRMWGDASDEMLTHMFSKYRATESDVEIRRVSVLSKLLDGEQKHEPLCDLCKTYLDELDSLLSEWECRSNTSP